MDRTTLTLQAAQLQAQIHSRINDSRATNNFFATGKLGLAYYYLSCYELQRQEDMADQCIGLLQEVMNEEDDTLPPLYGTGFASGTSGMGYLLALLKQKGLIDPEQLDELADMDEEIFTNAIHQAKVEERLDYLHGAFSAVHYFLQRADEPRIRDYLVQLITAIAAKAEYTSEGCWFPNFITDVREKERIDLSISHGNAGFLLLLLQVHQAGMLTATMEELITKGIQFILARRQMPDTEAMGPSLYPFYINRRDMNYVYANTRLAWCYGDLNIAWLLFRAAEQLQQPAWKAIAREITLHTMNRKDTASTMAEDSHFCHGTSGLVHFYNLLHKHTGEAAFASAADHWMAHTVQWLEKELTTGYYQDKQADLLNGLPGISLSLLSYINPDNMAWGRAFLL